MGKKIIFGAIISLICGCSYSIIEPEKNQGLVEGFTLIATDARNQESRTILNADYTMQWEASDQLGLLNTSTMVGNYQMSTSEEHLSNNNTIAEFTATSAIPVGTYIAYYPYQKYAPGINNPIPVQTEITYNGTDKGHIAKNDILYSSSVDVTNENNAPALSFYHLLSAFNFKVKLTSDADIKLKGIRMYADVERSANNCTTKPFLRACHIEMDGSTPTLANKAGYETNMIQITLSPEQSLNAETYFEIPMIVAYKATTAPAITIIAETDKGFFTLEKSAVAFTAGNIYETPINIDPAQLKTNDPLATLSGTYSVETITSGSNGNINNMGTTVYTYDEYCSWADTQDGGKTYNSDAFEALNFDYCIATHGSNLMYPLCFNLTDTETTVGSGKFKINCLAVIEPGNTTTDLGSYYDSSNNNIVLNFSQGGSTYKFELSPMSSSIDGTIGTKEIYLPEGQISDFDPSFRFRTADLNDDNSYFSLTRSQESENLIVFWEKEFGNDPSQCSVVKNGESMAVDIDDMLTKMEAFYKIYAENMNFIVEGLSNTDRYKMHIYLFCTDGWIANGGGVDNKLGAFWISPGACKPVGQTVAHELGHSFQYQVYCDDPAGKAGYRHNIGTGNAFWEMSANYQAWKSMVVGNYTNWNCEIPYYQANAHRGVMHEWLRYQNFFILNHWESIHGEDLVGRIWRESVPNEDPFETYKRITNTTQSQMNDELWHSVCKECVWDFEHVSYMRSMISSLSNYDRTTWFTNKNDLVYNSYDGYYRPSHDPATEDPGTTYNRAFAPQSYGRNIIELNVPTAGTEITINFKGINSYPVSTGNAAYRYGANAGWRWGVVATTGNDGWTPVYGEINRSNSGTATFTVPTNTKKLYLVVLAAPTEHAQKTWDGNVTNDYEYPYRFKVTGTTVNSSVNTITNEEVTTDEDSLNENSSLSATINDFNTIVM
ncbi:MAG: fimbrillin family protein [Odoribacter sp.]|nr:fimbrillin family protein [Odoribacter sp.]